MTLILLTYLINRFAGPDAKIRRLLFFIKKTDNSSSQLGLGKTSIWAVNLTQKRG
jgi:hypothetical protein